LGLAAYEKRKIPGEKMLQIAPKRRCVQCIKDLYVQDSDFGDVFNACEKVAFGKFYRHDGFLFRETKLCVPMCSLRELLVREAHGGGLMGHFGVAKTLGILHEHFFGLI
jgi:hypothetical protein